MSKMANSSKTGAAPKDASRRDFFRKAGFGFGFGAAGAAAVGFGSGEAEAADTEAGGTTKAGYQETAHVRKYYELARF